MFGCSWEHSWPSVRLREVSAYRCPLAEVRLYTNVPANIPCNFIPKGQLQEMMVQNHNNIIELTTKMPCCYVPPSIKLAAENLIAPVGTTSPKKIQTIFWVMGSLRFGSLSCSPEWNHLNQDLSLPRPRIQNMQCVSVLVCKCRENIPSHVLNWAPALS